MITTTLTGFKTEQEAKDKVEYLRQAYEIGYGFWPSNVWESPDGTWQFSYSRGSSCD